MPANRLHLPPLVYPGQSIIPTPEGVGQVVPEVRPWPQGEDDPTAPLGPDDAPHPTAPPVSEAVARMLSSRPFPWDSLRGEHYQRHLDDLLRLPLLQHLRLLQHLHERLPEGPDHGSWRFLTHAFLDRPEGDRVPITHENWDHAWHLHRPPVIASWDDDREYLARQHQRRWAFDKFVGRLPGIKYRHAFAPLGVDLAAILERDFGRPGLASRVTGPPDDDGGER
jgi:hypothetical protein